MILSLLIATVLGMAAFCPSTELGGQFHRILVQGVAARLNRGGLAAAAQAVAFMIVVVLVAAAPIAPELLPLALTIDFALFVEIAALLFIARGAAWARAAGAMATWRPRSDLSRLSRPLTRARARARRARRQRPGRTATDDSEPWPTLGEALNALGRRVSARGLDWEAPGRACPSWGGIYPSRP
jgi:hypothetical protein